MTFTGIRDGCNFKGCRTFLYISGLIAIFSCCCVIALWVIMVRDSKLQKDNSLKIVLASVTVVFIKCLLEFILITDVSKFSQNDFLMGLIIGLAYASLFWNMILGQLVNYVINHQLFIFSNKISFRSYDTKIEKQTKTYIINGVIISFIVVILWIIAEHLYIKSGGEDILIVVLQTNIPVILGALYLGYFVYHFHSVGEKVDLVAHKLLTKSSGKTSSKTSTTKKTKRAAAKEIAKQEELKRTCIILFIYPIYFIVCELLADIGILISAFSPNTPLSENWGYMSPFYFACRIPYHAQGMVDFILFLNLPVVKKRLKLGKYNKKLIKTRETNLANKNESIRTSIFSKSVINLNAPDSIEEAEEGDPGIELRSSTVTSNGSHGEMVHDYDLKNESKIVFLSKKTNNEQQQEEEDDDDDDDDDVDLLGKIDKYDIDNIGDDSETFENPVVVSEPGYTNNKI